MSVTAGEHQTDQEEKQTLVTQGSLKTATMASGAKPVMLGGS